MARQNIQPPPPPPQYLMVAPLLVYCDSSAVKWLLGIHENIRTEKPMLNVTRKDLSRISSLPETKTLSLPWPLGLFSQTRLMISSGGNIPSAVLLLLEELLIKPCHRETGWGHRKGIFSWALSIKESIECTGASLDISVPIIQILKFIELLQSGIYRRCSSVKPHAIGRQGGGIGKAFSPT